MQDVIVSENITIDGVVSDPTGEEGHARGGWFTRVSDDARAEWANVALAEAQSAGSLLLGRRTYDFFAGRWPFRSGPLAERLNTMPKHVVTRTAPDRSWAGTRVLRGDVKAVVALARESTPGDVLVYGSASLVRGLLAAGLVDELRLTLFPALAGDGDRIFVGASAQQPDLRLTDVTVLGSDLAHLIYRRVND